MSTNRAPPMGVNWAYNPDAPAYTYDAIGFGWRAPRATDLLFESPTKPSIRCRGCDYTLVCVGMAIFPFTCKKCGVMALWVPSLRSWLWDVRASCPHSVRNVGEFCHSCATMEAALTKLKKSKEATRQTYTTTGNTAVIIGESHIWVSDTTAGPVAYTPGTIVSNNITYGANNRW